jgi:hypothetical protein
MSDEFDNLPDEFDSLEKAFKNGNPIAVDS